MQRNSNNYGDATLLLDVWLVSHLTARLLDDALRPVGLTGDEFGLYSLIHSGGPLTPTEISRCTGMAATTISGMMRRIAARGHLDEDPHPHDARKRLLRLSDSGRSVTKQAAGILASIVPILDDALDGGQDAIRVKLGVLDDGLRQLVDAAPRPYSLPGTGEPSERPTISYQKPLLSQTQVQEVRSFIDWLRTKDSDIQ